jgi:hypothetical protein
VQYNLSYHVKENEKAKHAVRVSEISWMWRHVKEQACSAGNVSDLYSKGTRFECRLGFPLYLMTFSWFPLVYPGNCNGSTFNLRNILPYPFRFNIHYNPVGRHIIWITDRVIKKLK